MKNFEIDFLESYDADSILKELKRIATVTSRKTVTKKDIQNFGRVSYETIYARFGCLRKALDKAGLISKRFTKAEDNELLDELHRLATLTGKQTVTRQDIEENGRISYYTIIINRFGSLRQALEKASLKTNKFTKSTEEELLRILVELWEQTLEKEGRRPYESDLKIYGCAVSHDTIVQRFGSWKKALRRAFDSVNEEIIKAEEVSPTIEPDKKPVLKTRKGISLTKRFFIFKRDQFTCQICGKSGHGMRPEVDHKVSVHDGGTDALDNLWTLCFECNRGKSKTSL
jgi:histone H3/H4